jgi:predicted ATPase
MVGDLIGEGAAQEQAVVGDTPNLAARLQGLATPGTVVIGSSTRRLLGAQGRVVLRAGEAGIGKSRLVHEQRERLHDEPHFALSYYCSPYHTNSALRSVVEQLERAAGFTPADDPAVKLGKLKVLLGQGSDVLEDHVSLIGELLSIIDTTIIPHPI